METLRGAPWGPSAWKQPGQDENRAMATSASDAHDALRTVFDGDFDLDFEVGGATQEELDFLEEDEEEEHPNAIIVSEAPAEKPKPKPRRPRPKLDPAEQKRRRLVLVAEGSELLTKVNWTKERAEAAASVFSSVGKTQSTSKEVVLAAGDEYDEGAVPTIEQARKAVLNSRPMHGVFGETKDARSAKAREDARERALQVEREKSKWCVGIQLMRVAERYLGDAWTAKSGKDLAQSVADHLIATQGKTDAGLRSLLKTLRDSNSRSKNYSVGDKLFAAALAKK